MQWQPSRVYNGPEGVSARRLRLSRPQGLEVVVRGHDVEVDLLDVARRAEPWHPPAKVNEKGSIERMPRMDGCCLAYSFGRKAVLPRVLETVFRKFFVGVALPTELCMI